MDKKKRWLFILSFFISTVAVAFLAAAFATDYWIEAYPRRNVTQETEDGARVVTGGELDTKFQGYIQFGLFHGYKSLDHGLGVREGEIWIKCVESDNVCGWEWDQGTYQDKVDIFRQYHRQLENDTDKVSDLVQDNGLFNFALWVCTIVFAALAIVWGLVSMAFAAVNAATRPIETITGPMGLYLWNGLASLFSLLSVIMYVVLYYQDLRKNVLNQEDREVFLWTSEDRAYLHYSFYFVVVSTILYAINILVVLMSGTECHPVSYGRSMNEKAIDGVMMY